MYYLAKIAQGCGLLIIAIDFLRSFPHLMNMKVLGAGIILYAFGWITQSYLLKK